MTTLGSIANHPLFRQRRSVQSPKQYIGPMANNHPIDRQVHAALTGEFPVC